jgi:hypothetical protein
MEERLIFREERRAGDDGLSGVHRPSDLAAMKRTYSVRFKQLSKILKAFSLL